MPDVQSAVQKTKRMRSESARETCGLVRNKAHTCRHSFIIVAAVETVTLPADTRKRLDKASINSLLRNRKYVCLQVYDCIIIMSLIKRRKQVI